MALLDFVTLLDGLAQMLSSLLDAILYPFQLFYLWIKGIVSQILDPFFVFFDSVYALFSSVYDFFSSILSYFPVEWVVLILSAFTIFAGLWLYSYLKDVEIFGFKI